MKRIFLPILALVISLSACGAIPDSPTETERPPLSQDQPQETEAPPAEELDELGELYLQVLEDLWAVDSGLNNGAIYCGMDLSALTHLPEGSRHLLAQTFANAHSLTLVEDTWEGLCRRGYINKEERYWEDGVFFQIKTNEEAAWNTPALGEGEEPSPLSAFDAHKWRSGLGAYFFGDCVAKKLPGGAWSYWVGHEAIA